MSTQHSPLTAQRRYQGWSVRSDTYPAGYYWGVMVEVFKPGTGAGMPVPVNELFPSESDAADAGIALAQQWIDERLASGTAEGAA